MSHTFTVDSGLKMGYSMGMEPCKINILQVEVDGKDFNVYGACIGPYVRKCYGLKTGFNVPTRICHMCDKTATWFSNMLLV